ncbi:hypothetical protein FAVG1_06414 [Fusarium avenaceum]|nr:hypothetical protein FAVG1_06414 [Fusarium avenaceum]
MSSLKKDTDSAGLEEQNGPRYGTIDVKVGTQRDLLDLQDLDPAFNEKMRLVNNAIDEIGWTPYHMKLFFLNGFGCRSLKSYAVDSMITLFQSIIAAQAFREFGEKGYVNGLTIATYVGMLTGALFWGFGADIIGRKYAFNISLFLCSISCIIAGGMPSWASLGVFVSLLSFSAGGNLVMDTTVFLEYLPSNKQWLLTLMASTMNDALMLDAPAAQGNISQKMLKAIVMKHPWQFDDTDPSLPHQFRNQIPGRLKQNGQFHLPVGTEGLLVNFNGKWGRVMFQREDTWVTVMVPKGRMIVGENWRTFQEKLDDIKDSTPTFRAFGVQFDGSRLERYIRLFFNCLRQQIEALRKTGLSERVAELQFGSAFQDNVNNIIAAITPQARSVLRQGTATLEALTQLPQITATWPIPGSQVIYLRIYAKQEGGNRYALYGGQSVNAWKRCQRHNKCISSGVDTSHYNTARKSAATDRYMVPLIIWNPNDPNAPNQEVFNMAEQLVISMFNTYVNWLRNNQSQNLVTVDTFNKFAIMDTAGERARAVSDWPNYSPVGCNASSPLFGYVKQGNPLRCYRTRFPTPGERRKSVYRKTVTLQTGSENSLQAELHYRLPNGSARRFPFRMNSATRAEHQLTPRTIVYLVFEIMDDGLAHDIPWVGCPEVGPFENFIVASSLSVRIEWYHEATSTWLGLPFQSTMNTFAQGVAKSDLWVAISSWRKAMNIIQLLEGIDYEGELNGFSRSVGELIQVKELVVDHLQQKFQWEYRKRKTRPAPQKTTFEDNVRKLARQFQDSGTLVYPREAPADDSDFWRDTLVHPPKVCDFCYYMGIAACRPTALCIKDPAYTQGHVCKPCALMKRPCTFTRLTKKRELWGVALQGEPALKWQNDNRGDVGNLRRNPPGPHRYLAFHETIYPGSSKAQQAIAVPAPIEGREGLRVTLDDADIDEELGDEDDDEISDD